MLYNVLRFGSPMDFGQKYQLASYDPATREGNKLAYVPPGMWYYLLSRPHLTLGFPFIYLAPPPASYPFDRAAGLRRRRARQRPAAEPRPSSSFALAAPVVLRGTARRVALGLAAIGLLIIVMASFAIWGATMRYEVDFASILLIVAALGWIGWAARLSGLRRRLLAGGGVLLIAWGAACGAAFGIKGYYDGLRRFSPKTFTRLQNLTSPIPTLISAIDGKPKTVDIFAPTGLESNTDPNQGVGSVTFPLADVPVGAHGRQRLGAPLRPAAQRRADPAAAQGHRRADPHARHAQLDERSRARFGPTIYPISLRRGLNRIQFRVTRPVGAITRLADVHIVPLPAAAP